MRLADAPAHAQASGFLEQPLMTIGLPARDDVPTLPSVRRIRKPPLSRRTFPTV